MKISLTLEIKIILSFRMPKDLAGVVLLSPFSIKVKWDKIVEVL